MTIDSCSGCTSITKHNVISTNTYAPIATCKELLYSIPVARGTRFIEVLISYCCLTVDTVHSVHHINPLNPELNPICYLLALLEAHHFLHVSRIGVKSLTFRLLIYIYIYIYIYGAPILDVSRSHTTTQHSR